MEKLELEIYDALDQYTNNHSEGDFIMHDTRLFWNRFFDNKLKNEDGVIDDKEFITGLYYHLSFDNDITRTTKENFFQVIKNVLGIFFLFCFLFVFFTLQRSNLFEYCVTTC